MAWWRCGHSWLNSLPYEGRDAFPCGLRAGRLQLTLQRGAGERPASSVSGIKCFCDCLNTAKQYFKYSSSCIQKHCSKKGLRKLIYLQLCTPPKAKPHRNVAKRDSAGDDFIRRGCSPQHHPSSVRIHGYMQLKPPFLQQKSKAATFQYRVKFEKQKKKTTQNVRS